MQRKTGDYEIEFSRPVDITTLPSKKKRFSYEASVEECAKLAMRLGCAAIEYLEARVEFYPYSNTDFMANVSMRSKVTQECVVTMEPVITEVDATVSLRLVPNSELCDADSFYESSECEIENFEGDVFDIGELLTQYLSLEIPLSPRSKNAPTFAETDGEQGVKKDSPFKILSSLKTG